MDGAYSAADGNLESIKNKISELSNSFTTEMIDDDAKSAETAKGNISKYTDDVEKIKTALKAAYDEAKTAGDYI